VDCDLSKVGFALGITTVQASSEGWLCHPEASFIYRLALPPGS
jgi:hypothetical protein